MSANHSRLRREMLRQEAEERQAARANRKPLEQLKLLKARGVSVPSVSAKELKNLSVDSKMYCKEVVRLVKQLQSNE